MSGVKVKSGVYKHKPTQVFQKGHKTNLGKKFGKKGVNKICPTCQKEFYVCNKASNRRHYCSKQCLFESPEWKNDISKRQTGRKLSEETKKKLSLAFQGENSSLWRGGKSFEPYSVDWTKTLKRSIRERDNYICQKCNQYGNVVHHIDEDKLNCDTDNLVTVCTKCHRKIHSKK